MRARHLVSGVAHETAGWLCVLGLVLTYPLTALFAPAVGTWLLEQAEWHGSLSESSWEEWRRS
jgi:hypothetical protein